MYRLVSRPILSTASKLAPQRLPSMRQKSTASGSGGGKVILTGLVTLTGVAGGVIGYAGYDPEFRVAFQDTVPGSKDVFDAVLGEEEKKPKSNPQKKPDAIAAPPSKMRIQPTTPPPPMPEIEKPKAVKKESVEKKKEIPAPVESKIDTPTKPPSKAVSSPVSLEKELSDACKDMEAKVKSAIDASKTSVEATRHHMALVRAIMDGSAKDENKAWNEVFEAANKKTDLLKQADDKLSNAKEALNKAIDKIEAANKDSNFKEAESLKQADAKANSALKDLKDAFSSLDSAQKEAKLVEDYRNLVEEGREQFQKEIEAILPERKLGKSGAALTEEDLNIFMTHAYRKVCQLQEELAKSKTIDTRGTSSSSEQSSDENLQAELDAQRREMELDHHKKLSALRDEMEKEMRTQLRRQAAAHVDHINDVLEVQSNELKRLHERNVNEVLANEQASYKREMAVIKGTLDGLDRAMEDKTFMKNASHESQELWLACVALQKSLNSEENVPLGNKIKAIEKVTEKSIALAKDDTLKTLLNAIPEAAKTSGVSSGGQIKARFEKVEEMAKRTALIGEEGGSLFLYGLSYLQSMFMISPSKTTKVPNKETETIDVNELNTFDIVWLARKAMESDDLEQAVKYMNLLQGEPRRQASDWLKSARLYLEMGLVCEALTTYATAVGAEAVPAK